MKILVIRMSSIGDVLLTTPVLQAFKNKYPEAEIHFLVMDQFKEAILGSKYVDKIIVFKKKENDGFKNMLKFADNLKKENYDYIFDLHAKLRSKIITRRMKGKIYTYKKRSWWKSILVNAGLTKYKVDDTIVRNYFGAFKDFGILYDGEKIEFVYGNNLKYKEYKNYPIMAPGASKETKKWTADGFGRLAKMIFEKHKVQTILLGGRGDIEKCNEINRISGGHCINLAGKITLKESGAILSLGRFLVTNDSGPFHIARGVECPTFVIFGPTSPGMFEFGEKDTLVYAGVECSPCSLHGDKKCPKGHFKCMKDITSEMLFDMIENKIKWEE